MLALLGGAWGVPPLALKEAQALNSGQPRVVNLFLNTCFSKLFQSKRLLKYDTYMES